MAQTASPAATGGAAIGTTRQQVLTLKDLGANSPIRLHGSAPGLVKRPAPLLGQDTDRVLAELLGLDAAELAALHAAGVIEPAKS